MTVEIQNNGPLIRQTNYFNTDLARRGKVFVSVNAGAIRLLLPPMMWPHLSDMRAAGHCVLSRGPWPDQGLQDAAEIMFDDGSDAPFALHLTPASFDLLPGEPGPGVEWVLSAWAQKDGQLHKALERVCYWRRVGRLPWLKPWRKS